jgi:hypothetical protein
MFNLYQCFPNFFARRYLGFDKITADPHFLAHVNIGCPDDRKPELKMYVSERRIQSIFRPTPSIIEYQTVTT